MTRLCILFAALALIARTRVPVLPGWLIPLPVVLTVALLALAVTVATWTIARSPRMVRTVPDLTPEPESEVTGS